MLGFVTPPDVRRSFHVPPRCLAAGGNGLGASAPNPVETRSPEITHRLRPDPARLQEAFPDTLAHPSLLSRDCLARHRRPATEVPKNPGRIEAFPVPRGHRRPA